MTLLSLKLLSFYNFRGFDRHLSTISIVYQHDCITVGCINEVLCNALMVIKTQLYVGSVAKIFLNFW